MHNSLRRIILSLIGQVQLLVQYTLPTGHVGTLYQLEQLLKWRLKTLRAFSCYFLLSRQLECKNFVRGVGNKTGDMKKMREPFFNIYLLPGIGINFPNFTD
jgi:hypothetical protein